MSPLFIGIIEIMLARREQVALHLILYQIQRTGDLPQNQLIEEHFEPRQGRI